MSVARSARGAARGAFTLVEGLVALAIAGVLVSALAQMFLGTQRDAAMIGERLEAALLAHGVAERVRAQVTSDPSALRAMPAEREVAPAELLGEAAARLSDYRVKIELADDPDLEPARGEPALASLSRRLTVSVRRADRPRVLARRVARLLAPLESLGDESIDALYQAHAEPWPLERTRAQFDQEIGMLGDPNFAPGSPIRRAYQELLGEAHQSVAVANAVNWVVYEAANLRLVPGSHQLPEPGFEPRTLTDVHSTRDWTALWHGSPLSPIGLDGDRMRLYVEAELSEPRAYLRGAHQAAAALEELDRALAAFLDSESAHLDALIARLSPAAALIDRLRQPGLTAVEYDRLYPQLVARVRALAADPELRPGGALHECFYTTYSLWMTLDGYTPHRVVLDHMAAWPDFFEQGLSTATRGLAELCRSTVCSPFERAEGARAFMDVLQVRTLARGPVPDDARSALALVAAPFRTADPDLFRYLTDPAHLDARALAVRHSRWLEDWNELGQLSNPPVHPLRPDAYAPDRPHHLHAILQQMDGGKIPQLCQMWRGLLEGAPRRPGA